MTGAAHHRQSSQPEPAAAGHSLLDAFCAARIEANSAETKAENVAVIQKILTVSPAAIKPVVEQLLSLPQGKAQKMATPQAFMFAPPGATFYGITELTPGQYLYACFLPIGGENTRKAKAHWTQGMYGTFTVS